MWEEIQKRQKCFSSFLHENVYKHVSIAIVAQNSVLDKPLDKNSSTQWLQIWRNFVKMTKFSLKFHDDASLTKWRIIHFLTKLIFFIKKTTLNILHFKCIKKSLFCFFFFYFTKCSKIKNKTLGPVIWRISCIFLLDWFSFCKSVWLDLLSV